LGTPYISMFIYCSLVSDRCQRSLHCTQEAKNGKIHKEKEITSQNTQNRKQNIIRDTKLCPSVFKSTRCVLPLQDRSQIFISEQHESHSAHRTENTATIVPILHACYTTCSLHPPRFERLNKIW